MALLPLAVADEEPRETCLRCRRPASYCYCALLPALAPRTRVVILQHPRERDVAIGTARMAHLALLGSSLVQGVQLDAHPTVAPLLREDDVAVLFPGEGAKPLEAWLPSPPRTLVVLDGTWPQARKLLAENPKLASLPRLSFAPKSPGEYRIRKEPSDECLATIEALAAVLGTLEGDPRRFSSLLAPFRYMVDRQLAAAARAERTTRAPRRPRKREAPSFAELTPLLRAPNRAVLVYGEANCHPREQRAAGAPELLHLVASRPAEGARFTALLRPRRPLSPTAPSQLGVDASRLRAGEDVQTALARFRSFLGEDALLCAWGPYARDLLAREGEPRRGFIDLRALAARALQGSPGGLERGAERLSALPPSSSEARAERMLTSLERVLTSLLRRASGDAA